MPLEHWGYVPILYDISTQDLPQRVEDKYHSVIVWSEGKTKNSDAFYAWAEALKAKKIKILFLNSLIFKPTAKHLKSFGLAFTQNHNKFIEKMKVEYTKPYRRYEIPASIEYEEELILAEDAQSVVSTVYKNGQISMPIAITPWGGYALNGSFLHSIKDENYWTVNPFKFFKDALRLDNIPVPDPTTEAGRRILFVHIDGDGFMERVRTAPDKLAAEYLMQHIYSKYQIPQTVSLVQGEVDTIGLYPKLSSRMRKIAKKIYQIPWIEPASHTLSHPFFWGQADENLKRNKEKKTPKIDKKEASEKSEKHYHLPIPNYEFNLKSETKGSVDFILSLAPKSKQKERVIFWSGDCLPTKVVLAYCERDGILSINGGDTTIKKSDPWLSHIAPFGVQREEYWQIYTAQQNENVYTHNWLGPFWGYRGAIETFEMTEEPYRLKPINIYYHFYSGSKLASFKALNEVYSWAIKQKTSKLYTSQYIKKVRGFYRTAIGKIEGGYEIRNSGFLRTVRFDNKVNVDIEKSRGVAGFSHHKETTYVTLDSKEKQTIILNKNPSSPYLIDANGWVKLIKKEANSYRFTLESNVALDADFYLPKTCNILSSKEFKIKKLKDNVLFLSSTRKGVDVVFKCQ